MLVRPSPVLLQRLWLLLLPAVLCASCSKNSGLNPVQGKVLFKGQPLKGALITFHPKGEKKAALPIGLSADDGTFTLSTGQKEGAPAGDYTVTLICPEEVGKRDKKVISMRPPESKDRFEGAYANPATSVLTAQIRPGTNQLEPFQLK